MLGYLTIIERTHQDRRLFAHRRSLIADLIQWIFDTGPVIGHRLSLAQPLLDHSHHGGYIRERPVVGIVASRCKPCQVENQDLVPSKFGSIRLLRGIDITQSGNVTPDCL